MKSKNLKKTINQKDNKMRFDIMIHNRVIGHINFDDMNTPLMKALFALGYTIKVEKIGGSDEQSK